MSTRNAPLVEDASAAEAALRRFRSTEGLVGGGRDLRMSGSAQFSALALGEWLGRMRDPVTIVDLRCEPHGFADGAAVSWYGEHNAVGVGLPRRVALADERARLEALARSGAAAIGTKATALAGTEGSSRPVREVLSEEALVRSLGARYVRLRVPDHAGPDDEDVDRFLDAVEAGEGSWLHFHCRGGKGRTTTFMLLRDLLSNAAASSFEALHARQTKLAEGHDVLRIPEPGHPYAALRVARATLLRRFHAFARQRAEGGVRSWGEWIRREGSAR